MKTVKIGTRKPTILTLKNPWSGALIDMTASEIVERYDYDSIIQLADDDIVETLHSELAPCTEEQFIIALYNKLGQEEFSRITIGS